MDIAFARINTQHLLIGLITAVLIVPDIFLTATEMICPSVARYSTAPMILPRTKYPLICPRAQTDENAMRAAP
ncbi:MAG: hypothetical protein J6M07_06335, partial [Ruminococcus sp.]|nr:hypothetical protein [Ruminococcus sp.]